ncbi:hypothetical protein G6F61_007863 [Rhizopus arrhizus]|nr:hypothetical protein G6F61_007863 [Rhizopus arrhizus]
MTKVRVITQKLHFNTTTFDIVIPPARGTYNKIADPALTEDQLSEMDTYFKEFRKQLRCPACQTTTTFHRHGSSPKPPCQPQFTCTSCHKAVKAFEMYPLVHCKAQATQPAPDIDNIDIPDEAPTSSNSPTRLHTTAMPSRRAISPLFRNQSRTTAFPDAPWHNPAEIQTLKQSSLQQREQRRQQREAAAARFFQSLLLNQGFQHLYISTKARIPVGVLQTTFRKLEVNNVHFLDIHYPARNTAAILIHNDYEDKLIDILKHRNVFLKNDFDPSSGDILTDPKYSHLTTCERDTIAFEIQQTHLERALQHIRPLVKFAVAHFFLAKQWISKSTFDALSAERTQSQLSSIFEQNIASEMQATPPPDTDNDSVMSFQRDESPNFSSSGTTPTRH